MQRNVIFQRIVNFPDKSYRSNISLHGFAIWMLAQEITIMFHYLMKASESVSNLHIQMQTLPINDTAGAMQLIRNYYREWQRPEIYAKVLEYNTIHIFKGLTLMDFFKVVLLAKKEAETVGRPIEEQLLKYLIVRAAQSMHNKFWKALNHWLQDLTIG
jgi:hypothetical protein